MGRLAEAILLTGCMAFACGAARAQDWISTDARSQALGNAGVAFGEGADGLYWNPALAAAGAPIEPCHLGLHATPRGCRQPIVMHGLETLEREAILRALDETGGHRQKAAALLGISRRTLSRKLRQYEDQQPLFCDSRPARQRVEEAAGRSDHEPQLAGKTA